MDVQFETPRGRRFTLEIGFFDTVLEIKEKVSKYENIPVDSQRLFFEGQELLDDRDTEHYSIVQGSHLLLLLPADQLPVKAEDSAVDSASSKIIRVIVSVPPARRQFSLNVDASATVARLKEHVQEHTEGALPAGRQAIFYDRVELQDHRVLADCGPPGQMEVTAVVRQPQQIIGGAAGPVVGNNKKLRMMVFVRCGSKTIPVDVNASENVGELRKELGRVQHAHAHGQLGFHLPSDGGYFFIYKQNVMEDDRSFRWHDVKNGDTIEIFNGSVTG